MCRRLLYLASFLSSACSPDLTQLVLVVDTDFAAPDPLARVHFGVRGPEGEIFETDVDLAAIDAPPFPLTLALVPDSDRLGPISVTIEGRDASGEILVSRSAETEFLPGQSRMLRIALVRACADVRCAEGQSCTEIGCAPLRVEPADLPEWPQPAGGWGTVVELCNTRDDDGDGSPDEDFDFDADPSHCGACFNDCPDAPFAEPICASGACDIACREGSGDCDGGVENGCERDLASELDCGACDAACPVEMPLCTSGRGAPECTSFCAEGLTRCNTLCVDLETDLRHCGECGESCGDPGPGIVECIDRDCRVTCEVGTHECDGICLSDDSVDSCGDRCEPCPAGPNQIASCTAGACEYECEIGFADCNDEPGCESNLGAPSTCGRCDVDCGYGSCSSDGLCSNAVRGFGIGPRHACAVLNDDRTYCWGRNESGQLGNRSRVDSASPVRVQFSGAAYVPTMFALDDVTSYAIGLAGTDGWLRYWGANPTQPPATRTFSDRPADPAMYTQLGSIYSVVAGGGRGSILVWNQVWAWGDQSGGGLGDGVDGTGYLAPTMVEETNGCEWYNTISRGGNVGCWTVDYQCDTPYPELHCFGSSSGDPPIYIGDGDTMGSVTPQLISLGYVWNHDLGTDAGCAIEGGFYYGPKYHLTCWGELGCGLGGVSPTRTGFDTSGPQPLSVGRGAGCFQRGNQVHCFGDDWLTPGECFDTPTLLFPEYTDVSRVEAGDGYGCFMRNVAGGMLVCWGANDHGQLGRGTISEREEPAQVVFR